MDNNNELSLDELEKVTGGQYDPDVEYSKAKVVSGGNLYSISDIRNIVGWIEPDQEVEVHPEFEYWMNGKVFCIVRVNGRDYLTECGNIA